jgi:two-component system chemotaxis response regulator CheB
MLSARTDDSAKATVEALNLGAIDFVLKPTLASTEENVAEIRRTLKKTIEGISRVDRPQSGAIVRHRPPLTTALDDSLDWTERQPPEVIALGVSTGGPAALNQMLPRLPADLGVPVLIVQHMPPLFTKSMAEDLDRICPLAVHEAVDGQPVTPGSVLLAPGGRQMKLERSGARVVVRITDDPPEKSCRPSVDYLFRSVVDIYGAKALGVIMTGMGDDGFRHSNTSCCRT